MHIHKPQYLNATLARLAGVLALAALASAAFGQGFDTSGNGSLKGAYFVRELLFAGQSGSSISTAVSIVGTMTFDGNGNYSFTGQQTKKGGATNAPLSLNGTYKAAANGFVAIQSLADTGDLEYGGLSGPVGPNAFTASATEKSNLSIMVGIPVGSNLSNGSLKGAWSGAAIDFTNADLTLARNASFNFNSDGAGNLGNISASGMAANLGNTPTTQTVSGVTYSLSGSAGTVNFGASSQSQLISGTKNISVSADGNVIVGGAPDGFDFFIAVRSMSAASNGSANGVYYVSGMSEFATSNLPFVLSGYSGSANSTGSGTALLHQRLASSVGPVFDNTSGSTFSVAGDGTFQLSNNVAKFTLGDSGQAFIATGASGVYSLVVGFHAQPFSGSGVYLNPLGIVNAGSFAPATNPIAPGEIIAIFGSGLSSGTTNAASLPLPTNLGNVTVSINGVNAPLFYVSPTQITAMVPYSISGANYATVSVSNNGTASNSVTMYVRKSSPGVFSLAQSGVGQAAAEHGDYSVISSSNPAHTGETVTIYVGGLGAVNPAVQSGSAAPSNPPSSVTGTVLVTFDGITASTPAFAGLTPTAAGLYQINVAIPSGLQAGDATVNVVTAEGSTGAATLSVAP